MREGIGSWFGAGAAQLLVCAFLLLLIPAPGSAAQVPAQRLAEPGEFVLGSVDPRFVLPTQSQRRAYFDLSLDAGVEVVRLNAFWFQLAPKQPDDPRDPGDRRYRFGPFDKAVRLAAARGHEIVITMQRAPAWALRGRDKGERGVNRPSVREFGNFVHAIATRYSGSYTPSRGSKRGPLPRVRYFQAWNEPNLNSFLSPQRNRGNRYASARRFTRLVNRADLELNRIDPSLLVVAGGTSSIGARGRARTPPAEFWRAVFCLDRSLEVRRKCRKPIRFDVFDHHTIDRLNDPENNKPGWVTSGNYGEVAEILRAAEAQGRVLPAGERPMWTTEIYWETNPPDRATGIPPQLAARHLSKAMYLLWKADVSLITNFFLVDPPLREPGDPHNIQGGIYYENLTPKPSYTAYTFPLVSDPAGAGPSTVWGRSPEAGTVRIERFVGNLWLTAAIEEVGAGEVFETELPLEAGDRVRAKIGDRVSLIWRHGD